jgi:hypothetical protein
MLIGVTSFGPGSGCLNGPSAFARVTEFMPWIISIIGQWKFKGLIFLTFFHIHIDGSASSNATSTATTSTSKTTTKISTSTTTTKPPTTKKTSPPKCASTDFSVIIKKFDWQLMRINQYFIIQTHKVSAQMLPEAKKGLDYFGHKG